jgi:putative SOS response-associated peptidase YedK
VIPASAFYEWRRQGAAKHPLDISPADGSPLALAGLRATWTDTDTGAAFIDLAMIRLMLGRLAP